MTTLPEEFEAAFPCDKGCADCLAAKIRYSARTNEITLEDVGPDDHCDDCRARYRPAAAAAFNAWVERVAGEGLEGAVEGLARAHCDCGPPPASLGDAAPHACALSIVPEIVAAVAPLLAARGRRVEELEGELRRCVREANEKICRLLSESDKSTLEVPLVRSRLLGQTPWAASMKAHDRDDDREYLE